jgi:hypothetical protein
MRLSSTMLLAVAMLAIHGPRPSAAQYAAPLYPYCSLSASVPIPKFAGIRSDL